MLKSDYYITRQIDGPRGYDHRLLLQFLTRAIVRVMSWRVVIIIVLRIFMMGILGTGAWAKPSGKRPECNDQR